MHEMEPHCIEMDPEFILTRYGKIHRHGNDCREGRTLYVEIPRNRRHGCHARPQGKALGSVRRQKRKKENMVQSLYWGFQGMEWTKQGRYAV